MSEKGLELFECRQALLARLLLPLGVTHLLFLPGLFPVFRAARVFAGGSPASPLWSPRAGSGSVTSS